MTTKVKPPKAATLRLFHESLAAEVASSGKAAYYDPARQRAVIDLSHLSKDDYGDAVTRRAVANHKGHAVRACVVVGCVCKKPNEQRPLVLLPGDTAPKGR